MAGVEQFDGGWHPGEGVKERAGDRAADTWAGQRVSGQGHVPDLICFAWGEELSGLLLLAGRPSIPGMTHRPSTHNA